jgi:hypothetical protein
MCRPSCCNNSSGQGSGVAVVALIMLAVLVAARVGTIVTHIVHAVFEVVLFAALTTGLVLALAAATWAAITIIRWQRQRRTALAVGRNPLATTQLWWQAGPAGQRECLACGGSGMVLRAINGRRYQPQDCPACELARQAG